MYCQVFNLTRRGASSIIVHFRLHNADGSVRQDHMKHAISAIAYNADGTVKNETVTQWRQRIVDEFNDYVAREILVTALLDEYFDDLRGMALNYRYPAGG